MSLQDRIRIIGGTSSTQVQHLKSPALGVKQGLKSDKMQPSSESETLPRIEETDRTPGELSGLKSGPRPHSGCATDGTSADQISFWSDTQKQPWESADSGAIATLREFTDSSFGSPRPMLYPGLGSQANIERDASLVRANQSLIEKMGLCISSMFDP